MDDYTLLSTGKVRNLYIHPKHPYALLFVATDRLSAFDVVMTTFVPAKGCILTQLSLFWLHLLSHKNNNNNQPPLLHSINVARVNSPITDAAERDMLFHHLIQGSDLAQLPTLPPALLKRSIWVHKLHVIPLESIVRGYLTGSGYKEYINTAAIGCGDYPLSHGLKDGDPLPHPFWTPTTKDSSEGAHDMPVSYLQAIQHIQTAMQPLLDTMHLTARDVVDKMKRASLLIYTHASEYARQRGIVLVDTKLEFGLDQAGRLFLIDEILTPDSSRFWPIHTTPTSTSTSTSTPTTTTTASTENGVVEHVSFDKQFVRDYLTRIGFNKRDPVAIPDDITRKTAEKYREAFYKLTGSPFQD